MKKHGPVMKKLLFLVLAGVLTSCASTGPTVTTNADPSTDFGAIRTFGFLMPLGTDRPGGIRTPLSNMLIQAVSQELELMGMRPSDNPDVAINFFVNLEQTLDIRQVPTASSFHSYRRGRYRPWGGYQTRVRQVTQGTLAIDLIDPDRMMLVWEGIAEGRVPRGSTEITQDQINAVVAAVLKELPR